MPVTVTKSGPGLAKLAADLKRIEKSDVLVGIPSSNASRKTGMINNAEVLWLFSKGSPLNNQPPRPVLEPAIEGAKDKISPHLAKAAQSILQKDPPKAERELQLAGIIASNAAKRMFVPGANDWAPNAPSTIAAKGSDVVGVNLGLMRKALTWVVRENGSDSTPRVREDASGEAPEAPGSTGAGAAEGLGEEAAEGIGEEAITMGGLLL
jgi:hypothetical protein